MTEPRHSVDKTILPFVAEELMPRVAEDMRSVCRDAWEQGLLSGCNGNASCRLPAPYDTIVCLTRSGAAKGRLAPQDCCLVDLHSATPLYGGPASTESGMHLAIYRAKPHCKAILHTHPRRLLALSLRLESGQSGDQKGGLPDGLPNVLKDFLRLPLFEADVWRARLGFAPALPPGTTELADAVAKASLEHPAVWMSGHGLCGTGESLAEALCLTEELEHLAAIQLLSMS
ncbi:class II aldolase/adducin family protein [Desulfovibrio intestinalis]|uniref:L-fuculose-phosphate aldolase n=1 Tax=Desulfovibrio intestinalis TaxID=58621 RepID=A0A7W8C437_9BACT|nr:class II aldolase/adducin family protein [Desulfovibrio intestinalis]MBB5144087.1 L-fuculose-phosphate aldolase [Desulfovibrio intestinalis]